MPLYGSDLGIRKRSCEPSPLIYRDSDYWSIINLMEEVIHRRFPLDLADPAFEYRGRYFETR